MEVALSGLLGVFGGPACSTDYLNGDRITWVATIFKAALPMKPHLRLFLAALAASGLGHFQPPGWSVGQA